MAEENVEGAITGAPQPALEPRAPSFEPYPAAHRQWVFAVDADGRRLDALWWSVRTAGGKTRITDAPAFLTFVTELRCAYELDVCAKGCSTPSPSAQVEGSEKGRPSERDGRAGSCSTVVVKAPAPTCVARGVPADVVLWLAEAVFSAAVCRCGREISGAESPSSAGGGCPSHGHAAALWTQVLPSSIFHQDVEATVEDESVASYSRNDRRAGPRSARGVHGCARSGGEKGVEWRRVCLVEALRALAAVSRFSHAREELARRSRGEGGGFARGLASLCDALCSKIAELRRERDEANLWSRCSESVKPDRVRRELIFFVRCLTPLARIVVSSFPTGSAWHKMMHQKTQAGASSASTHEASDTIDLASTADRDEWTAMLVKEDIVRSLVDALQAFIDARVVAKGAGLTPSTSRTRPGDESVQRVGGNTLSGGPRTTQKTFGGFRCLGCELDTAQNEVVLALGALLSAHPLAARDRFQLAGGATRLHDVFSVPNSERDETHSCWLLGKNNPGADNGDTGFNPSTPFVHEHGFLAALRVVRLSLLADDSAAAIIPTEFMGEAARLVGLMSVAMRSVWNRTRVESAIREGDERWRRSFIDTALNGDKPHLRAGEGLVGWSRRHFAASREKLGRHRDGALSRELLGLRFHEEVAVPSFGNPGGSPVVRTSLSTRRVGDINEDANAADGSSYLLCGPREDDPGARAFSAPDVAGWAEDGLQTIARRRGACVSAVVASLRSRIVVAVEDTDIIRIAHSEGVAMRCWPSASGEGDGVASCDGGGTATATAAIAGRNRDRLADSRSPACGVLLLLEFRNVALAVIGDCKRAERTGEQHRDSGMLNEARTTRGRKTGDRGSAPASNAHETAMRSAMKCFKELLVERRAFGFGVAGDGISPGTWRTDCDGSQKRRNIAGGSRNESLHDTTADPVLALVSLSFFLQAVRCWPRLALSLFRELGVWNALFSESVLSQASRVVMQALSTVDEARPADVGATSTASATCVGDAGRGGNSTGPSDVEVGWGLVHDATLLLLETAVVVRHLLHVESSSTSGAADPRLQKREVEGDGRYYSSRYGDVCEVEEFLHFLAGGDDGLPPALSTMQGCRWLRTIIATESATGGGTLLPSPLRVSSLCLALRLCDRAHCDGSDAIVHGVAAWPHTHASVSLALDLVSSEGVAGDRRLLFQAALSFATEANGDGDSDSAQVAAAATAILAAEDGIHRTTASKSEPSTPVHHKGTTETYRETGTPVRSCGASPRVSPSSSSCSVQKSSHQRPRSVPEVLFKAALDPRVRRAAFLLATELGAQAVGAVVASQTGDDDCTLLAVDRPRAGVGRGQANSTEACSLREMTVEVFSGLVEGYLCLCERVAVSERVATLTAAGSSVTRDDPGLLQDALHGMHALVFCEKRRRASKTAEAVGRKRVGGKDDGQPERGELFAAHGLARTPYLRVSSLLQETFREHGAYSRLLDVLETVVAAVSSSLASAMTSETCSDVVMTSLSVFTALMAGNSPGKYALRRALTEHCSSGKSVSSAVSAAVPRARGAAGEVAKWADVGSFAALADLARVVPAAALSGALMEMLMDGEFPAFVLRKVEESEDSSEDGPGAPDAERADRREETRDESEGVTPPEIRNPLVVPLIFRMLPDWPAAEQTRTLEVFRLLLRGSGGGVINRSVCCDVQPALMDQLLDMIPRLNGGDERADGDGLQGLAIDLVRHLGAHSISVAQLKTVFRLLQPITVPFEDDNATIPRGASRRRRPLAIPKVSSGACGYSIAAPLNPPWMCSLLRALKGMMDDQPGPQRFFLLDGVSSGLRLPRMPRWPAQKGFTFCTWVRLEVPSNSINSVVGGGGGVAQARTPPAAAGAPCLFSFGGERGHGVAACFIPLRGRMMHENSPSAASPQQHYALELRVGTGRKKAPACIRYPSAFVTAGEWTFVAVSHSPSSWSQRGESAILLDRCWRTTASPFPRFGEGGVVAASVGCHYGTSRAPQSGDRERTPDEFGAGAKIAGRPALCSLPGQMGPIYLFSGCLPETTLRGVRELGPDYAFSFEPPQVDSREVAVLPTSDPDLGALSELGGENSQGSFRDEIKGAHAEGLRSRRMDAAKLHLETLDGALTPLIILAYNPSLWGGEYFLDNTPEHNPVRWTSGPRSYSETRPESFGSEGPAHGRVMHFMAGSQTQVIVHVNATSSSRKESGGSRRAPRHRWNHAGTQTRGWCGGSECSIEDIIFGGDEGESRRRLHPRPRPGGMHAMRLPGTRECVRRDVRDALDCLGGVKVLLPLFAQYDHGMKRGGDGYAGGAGGEKIRVNYETDLRLNETVLALLAGTLRDSVPNRRFLRRHDGLSLVQHCLERVSPQHMTPGALTQACRLADRLGSWSEDWADSAISCLLAPSHLWVFAPPEVQVTLAGVLRGLSRKCPGRMRRVIGVQRCLDALDLYFWYTPPCVKEVVDADPARIRMMDGGSKSREDLAAGPSRGGGGANGLRWSHASRHWVHPLTGEVLGVKATGVDLHEIRARLLDAVILMVCEGDGIGTADVAAALGFLRGCRDETSRCEALRLVLRIVDDPRQADRFAVASGYVAVETDDEDCGGSSSDDDREGYGEGVAGPGKGGAGVATFLSLLLASDPTVRLLSFIAMAQVLIACIRLDERRCAGTDAGRRNGSKHHRSSVPVSDSHVDPPEAASDSEKVTASSNTAVVEFMGGVDAKAEELAVLTVASVSRHERHFLSIERRTQDRSGTRLESSDRVGSGDGGGGGANPLELRGCVWRHIGLPRHRVGDILSWAQRHATRAGEGSSAGWISGNGASDADKRRQNGESPGAELRPERNSATARTTARVTMGVLQGLLFGELPRGFAASVVDVSDGRGCPQDSSSSARTREAPHTTFSPPADVSLDPFFLDILEGDEDNRGTDRGASLSWRQREQDRGDGTSSSGGNAPHQRRTRPRQGLSGGRASSRNSEFSVGSLTTPLLIRLPEAFPALCQQVATAPQGAVPRGAVVEVLVAAAQDRQNAKLIRSVDCWQQYLLSVVASAQGRQTIATSAARTASVPALNPRAPIGKSSTTGDWQTATNREGGVGQATWHGWRGAAAAAADAAEDERLVDLTVRLICWLVMSEVCEGKPARPGAGFSAIRDTMSFLRCQAELGTMECMSVGESILLNMVSLLKRETDCLENEINGWGRVSNQPSLLPSLGSSSSQHGAAAALACVWPLAALVIEFITIPPVPNPPADSAVRAPTPQAAASAVMTAAAAGDDFTRGVRWNEELLTCPSPIQGLLQWLDTSMRLPPPPQPARLGRPSQSTATTSKAFQRAGFARPPPDANLLPAAGSRAWELLDAAVDLVGPTGDTVLWDARYRHGLCMQTRVTDASGRGAALAGVVDLAATKVLDWGRRPRDGSGRRDDTRSGLDRGKPGGGDGSLSNGGARGTWFVDAKSKVNPLADAGGIPWMLVRLLLAIFVSGGAAKGFGVVEDGASSNDPKRCPTNGAGKSVTGAGHGPPSIALVALQRLIALMNSLESSGYEHYEFEVLYVSARVSTALRTTRLTPNSAWVLGALQLLAKCLAAQANQIEDLLLAAEERLDAHDATKRTCGESPLPAQSDPDLPRAHLIFSRRLEPAGWWWLWGVLTGSVGGKASRRRSIPKGVLHQIAAETPSLAAMRSADLTLEIIRRTLGIQLPSPCDGAEGVSASTGVAGPESAPLTWDLMEAAFQPVLDEGAGQEAVGLATRLDRGGMHAHALQVLARVHTLEGRGLEAGSRVPTDTRMVSAAVEGMEARRALSVAEAKKRATLRRQAQWEAILKHLTTERGPWGRGVAAVDLDSIYWTLSPGEDDRGRRLKLVRNPHGSRHTIASQRTRGVTRRNAQVARSRVRWMAKDGDLGIVADASPVPAAAAEEGSDLDETGQDIDQEPGGRDERGNVRAISAQTSLWRDLCKYQFKSYKEVASVGDGAEDPEEVEEEEEEEDEEDELDGSDGQHSTTADEDGDGGGWDGPRRSGGRTSESSGRARDSASFFSLADVVRPFNATPGTISLVGHRLVFVRSAGSSAAAAVEGNRDAHPSSGSPAQATVADNYRWVLRPAPNASWPTSALRRILFRPFGGMRFAALEMWFRGSGADDEQNRAEGTLLLGLPSASLARALHKALRRTRPPALEPFLGRLPVTIVARSKAGTWGSSAAGGVGMFGPELGSAPVVGGTGPAAEAARTPLTQAWLRRRCGITNFDYLRGLNAAAGRTTADLTRYPVFPWVLSERAWGAEELDLTDERNFRDLAWPMGAQRPEQREALNMRYQELERSYLEQKKMGGEMAEMALPPFHHGSHYSSSAYVLWYLMRVEPFTSLHIHLQDGRFDKSDRLFRSLAEAYRSCTRNPSDVKEAVPELYYLPEIFVNGTGLDLGRPQSTGKPLGDVELPPWAHGDPWLFVRRHREALESEHVSLRLHRWIDLVFGCRQRPPELDGGRRGAVESCNVFFHLTYPGAVDLPRLRDQDADLYASTMKQIEEFGQAPAQLFRSPHPPRLSLARADLVRPLASPVPGAVTSPVKEASAAVTPTSSSGSDTARDGGCSRLPYGVVSYPRERVSRGAVLLVSDLLPWAERLVTVDARRAIGYHGWRVLAPELSPPFRLRPDAVEAALSEEDSGSGGGAGGGGGGGVRRLGVPFAPGGVVSSRILGPPSYRSSRGEYGCSEGGLFDSLASMGSLLSFPESIVMESASLDFPCPRHVTRLASPARLTNDLDTMRYRAGAPSGAVDAVSRRGGGVGLGSHLFAIYAETRLVFSGGHWDSSFRLTNLDSGRLVVSITRHRDVVTSLSLADGGVGARRLVTASRDTTLMVWKVEPGRELPVSASSLLFVLYGHDTPLTCVCASAAMDVVVSSGEDGTVVVHTLWDGQYVRTITPRCVEPTPQATTSDGIAGRQKDRAESVFRQGERQLEGNSNACVGTSDGSETKGDRLPLPWAPVEWVGLSAAGYVVAYSPADATLRSYTVNGHALGAARVNDEAGPLRAFAFSEDGTVLLSGGHDRAVTLRWVYNLALADYGGREGYRPAVIEGDTPPLAGVPGASAGVKRFPSAVRCLALTAGERHLLVGLEDGTLGVLALDADYLRQRLRCKLDRLGI